MISGPLSATIGQYYSNSSAKRNFVRPLSSYFAEFSAIWQQCWGCQVCLAYGLGPVFQNFLVVGWLAGWLVAALYYVLEVWEYNPPVLFPNHEGGMVQISIGLQANRYMDNIYIYISRLIDVLTPYLKDTF